MPEQTSKTTESTQTTESTTSSEVSATGNGEQPTEDERAEQEKEQGPSTGSIKVEVEDGK